MTMVPSGRLLKVLHLWVVMALGQGVLYLVISSDWMPVGLWPQDFLKASPSGIFHWG